MCWHCVQHHLRPAVGGKYSRSHDCRVKCGHWAKRRSKPRPRRLWVHAITAFLISTFKITAAHYQAPVDLWLHSGAPNFTANGEVWFTVLQARHEPAVLTSSAQRRLSEHHLSTQRKTPLAGLTECLRSPCDLRQDMRRHKRWLNSTCKSLISHSALAYSFHSSHSSRSAHRGTRNAATTEEPLGWVEGKWEALPGRSHKLVRHFIGGDKEPVQMSWDDDIEKNLRYALVSTSTSSCCMR